MTYECIRSHVIESASVVYATVLTTDMKGLARALAEEGSSKRSKYLCKFRTEWTKKDPVIVQSKKGVNYAFCTTCAADISVGAGGWNDIAKHKNTTKHIEMVKQRKGQTEVSRYFQESTSNCAKVIRAETLFAQFVAEHNLPFSVADHYTQLAVQMFPDSEVARNFSCARTKTTSIIKGALAPHVFEKIVT